MTDIDLKKMSDLELAEYKQGIREDNPRVILVNIEFERRSRLEQHKLDLVLIAKQVRWMKFSVIAAIAAAIISALLTYILTSTTEEKYQRMIREMSKKQVIESLSPLPSEILPSHPSQKAKDGKTIYIESSGTSKK
jgi:hypothetical protein